MYFNNHDKSDYGLDMDLLTILERVSYLRRSGLDGKNNHFRPIYLMHSMVVPNP